MTANRVASLTASAWWCASWDPRLRGLDLVQQRQVDDGLGDHGPRIEYTIRTDSVGHPWKRQPDPL